MKNSNGSGDSGNGHDEDPKIARFPTPAERKEIERMKASMEHARDAAKAAGLGSKQVSEPIFNLPPAVKWLCFALVAVQVAMEFSPDDLKSLALENLAFIPARYTGGLEFYPGGLLGPFTHVLLHGGWLHLGMNVGTLMAFGSGIEKTTGWKKLLVLFFASSLIGAFAHFAYVPHDLSPLIGASGGISGLFGAVLVMAQEQGRMAGGKAGMHGMMPIILVWIGISLFFGLFGMPGEKGAIAWTTHIGGFIAGLLLYKPVNKLKI